MPRLTLSHLHLNQTNMPHHLHPPHTMHQPNFKKPKQVWFMISGEMGRSIFAFPQQHAALVAKYKERLSRGGRAAGGNVKVGLALHWNKVCGACFDVPNDGTAASFNASYAQVCWWGGVGWGRWSCSFCGVVWAAFHTAVNAALLPRAHMCLCAHKTPRTHTHTHVCDLSPVMHAPAHQPTISYHPTDPNTTQAFAASKDALAAHYNFSAIRALFESVDVLGISHYAPLPPQQMSAASFEVGCSSRACVRCARMQACWFMGWVGLFFCQWRAAAVCLLSVLSCQHLFSAPDSGDTQPKPPCLRVCVDASLSPPPPCKYPHHDHHHNHPTHTHTHPTPRKHTAAVLHVRV